MVGTSPISGMRVDLETPSTLSLPFLHLGQGGQHAVHEHLGLPGHGVLNGGDTALVGDVLPAAPLARSSATPARCGALPVAVTAKFRSFFLE